MMRGPQAKKKSWGFTYVTSNHQFLWISVLIDSFRTCAIKHTTATIQKKLFWTHTVAFFSREAYKSRNLFWHFRPLKTSSRATAVAILNAKITIQHILRLIFKKYVLHPHFWCQATIWERLLMVRTLNLQFWKMIINSWMNRWFH